MLLDALQRTAGFTTTNTMNNKSTEGIPIKLNWYLPRVKYKGAGGRGDIENHVFAGEQPLEKLSLKLSHLWFKKMQNFCICEQSLGKLKLLYLCKWTLNNLWENFRICAKSFTLKFLWNFHICVFKNLQNLPFHQIGARGHHCAAVQVEVVVNQQVELASAINFFSVIFFPLKHWEFSQ